MSPDCPAQMLCVPLSSSQYHHDVSVQGECKCSFSIDLTSDSFGGCKLTNWSWSVFAFHAALGVVSAVWCLGLALVLLHAQRDGVLQIDRLFVCSTMACAALCALAVSRIFRCGRMLSFAADDYDWMQKMWGVTQGLFGALFAAAVVLFGLAMHDIMRRTVFGKSSNPFSRKEFSLVCLAITLFSAVTVPLTISWQQGLMIPVASIFALLCWAIAQNRFTRVRRHWRPAGMYETERKRSEATLQLIDIASTKARHAITILNVFGLMYGFCWYYGRATINQSLMTRVNVWIGCVHALVTMRALFLMIELLATLFQEQARDVRMLKDYGEISS
jgi:hypothetical protein